MISSFLLRYPDHYYPVLISSFLLRYPDHYYPDLISSFLLRYPDHYYHDMISSFLLRYPDQKSETGSDTEYSQIYTENFYSGQGQHHSAYPVKWR